MPTDHPEHRERRERGVSAIGSWKYGLGDRLGRSVARRSLRRGRDTPFRRTAVVPRAGANTTRPRVRRTRLRLFTTLGRHEGDKPWRHAPDARPVPDRLLRQPQHAEVGQLLDQLASLSDGQRFASRHDATHRRWSGTTARIRSRADWHQLQDAKLGSLHREHRLQVRETRRRSRAHAVSRRSRQVTNH